MKHTYPHTHSRWGDILPETPAGIAFTFALTIRLLALPLSVVGLNPYSEHDATRFDMYAAWIANGHVTHWDPMNVYHVWSGILSPFYLIPGPGAVYARVFIAVLGAASVYFVFRIAQSLAGRRAAVFAVLPLIFFPSFILIHVSLIREAGMLFLHTLIAYALLVPDRRLTTLRRWGLTAVALVPLTLLRKEHLPVYLLILGLGVLGWGIDRRGITLDDVRALPNRVLAAGAAGALAVGLPAVYYATGKVLALVAQNRAGRAFGNSVYLPNIIPGDLLTAVWFAPIGTAYFYFAPFPWMVQGVLYLPVMAEGILNIGLMILAITGGKWLLKKHPVKVLPLLAGFVLFSVFYGLVEANVGAAVRHRQQFVWVLYMFAGVGLIGRFTPTRF